MSFLFALRLVRAAQLVACANMGDRRCARRWRTSAIMLAAAAASVLEAKGAGADLLPANNDRVSLARNGGGGARACAESCMF